MQRPNAFGVLLDCGVCTWNSVCTWVCRCYNGDRQQNVSDSLVSLYCGNLAKLALTLRFPFSDS